MNRLIFAVFLLFIFSNLTFGQLKNFKTESQIWLSGMAKLKSGEKISGKLNYNFVTETIQINDGDQIQSYIPKNVQYFIVKDSTGRTQKYFSFSQQGKEDKFPKHHFYEVLYKNKSAAILSHISFGFVQRSSPNSGSMDNNGVFIPAPTSSIQTNIELVIENICFIGKDGNVIPYLSGKIDKSKELANAPLHWRLFTNTPERYAPQTEQEAMKNSNFSKEPKKYKIHNRKALEELMGKEASIEIRKYIDGQNVNPKSLRGVIQIIDYWSESQ